MQTLQYNPMNVFEKRQKKKAKDRKSQKKKAKERKRKKKKEKRRFFLSFW